MSHPHSPTSSDFSLTSSFVQLSISSSRSHNDAPLSVRRTSSSATSEAYSILSDEYSLISPSPSQSGRSVSGSLMSVGGGVLVNRPESAASGHSSRSAQRRARRRKLNAATSVRDQVEAGPSTTSKTTLGKLSDIVQSPNKQPKKTTASPAKKPMSAPSTPGKAKSPSETTNKAPTSNINTLAKSPSKTPAKTSAKTSQAGPSTPAAKSSTKTPTPGPLVPDKKPGSSTPSKSSPKKGQLSPSKSQVSSSVPTVSKSAKSPNKSSSNKGPGPSKPPDPPKIPLIFHQPPTPARLDPTDGSIVVLEKKKRIRRGGKQVRGRRDKAAVREMLVPDAEALADEHLITPQSLSRLSPEEEDEWSEDGSSGYLHAETGTDEDEDDEDEVDNLSALDEESLEGSPRNGTRYAKSVLSTEDAKSSIDSFLTDSDNFTLFKANKLRLWQAICIELGLVAVPSESSCPVITPRPSETETDSDSDDTIDGDSRCSTPRPPLPPIPQSLTQARRILQMSGHVNIIEYLDARRSGAETGAGSYEYLIYPSAVEMMRVARKKKKLARLQEVKREWLEPLLRDFGFKRRREAAV
ncbi:hypothetical protein M231_01308 [Tremella mesenterica]|uniref:Uncharacterized protein n=1 Tax=Tremella mesenterica TaxID=5217 RepID=A0A4Q1BTJ8_TREME|nr:hypothetical protein M231_01308 [Tremella mesenterica]